MSKTEKIKDGAFMVLSDLAFCFEYNDSRFIRIYNLNNIKQTTLLLVRTDGSFLLRNSNMSDANKYKGLAIAERNRQTLIGGFIEWESTRRRE